MTFTDAYAVVTLFAIVGTVAIALGWAYARGPEWVAVRWRRHRVAVADHRQAAAWWWAAWGLLRWDDPATVCRPADPSPEPRSRRR